MSSRKSLGFIQTEWTCPNCDTRNPGPQKTCTNCGAPQPENVNFSIGAEQEFVTDDAEIKAASAGADIHCGYCGARNPVTAEFCSQCGANLKEGHQRTAGEELTFSSGPKMVVCGNCGAESPSSKVNCKECGAPLPRLATPASPQHDSSAMAFSVPSATPVKPVKKKKPNWLLLGGIGGFLAICCIAILFLFVFPSKSVKATVTDVYWQTYVPVQEVQAVQYTNERGSAPSDAYDVSCHTESQEVCEQKTIDRGNGYAEVVEDCHTESEQYCDYTLNEWQTIQTYTLDGHDYSPIYQQPDLTNDQRYGGQSVDLTVTFDTENGEKAYTPSDTKEFQQFQIGSQWILRLNALGGVVGIEK